MSEVFLNHLEEQADRNNKSISVFDDAKYTQQKESFYKKIKDNPDEIKILKDFIWRQNQDKKEVWEYIKNLETQTHNEAREWLDKQAMINEAKTMLYEKLWINDNLELNNWWENFLKWVVDEMILNNYDLAIQVWETNWKIILDWLSQLASWDWLKQIAKALWESIWTIWDWNAYEKWKAVAELWLIWTWVWAWVYVWKKGLKLWMKQISKLRKPSERVVESSQAKNIIWEIRKEIDEIVPKKELDFENLIIEDVAKLWDKDRIDTDLIIKELQSRKEKKEYYTKLDKLWLTENFIQSIEKSWIWGSEKLWIVKRYERLNNQIEDYFNRQKKWEIKKEDYIEFKNFNNFIDIRLDEINSNIKKWPKLTKTEANLIFSLTDNFLFNNLNTLSIRNKEIIWNTYKFDTIQIK